MEVVQVVDQIEEHVDKVKQLYKELLGREADSGGLHTYGYSGMDLEQVRASLTASPEYMRLQQKKSNKGVAVNYLEANLAVGSRPEKVVDTLSENFDLVVDIYGEELEGHEELTHYYRVNAFPESVLPIDGVEGALKKIEAALRNDERVIIVCDDGVGSVVTAVLWYISQGFDEDAAKGFIFSRVAACDKTRIDPMIGPWHLEAVTDLFKPE